MKKQFLFSLIVSVIAFAGCDVISEGDRIVTMDKIIPLKKVLVLDFTDQACPNCPLAGIEVEDLKKAYYGQDIIAVTIHASAVRRPLWTEAGNAYDIYFGTRQSGHPAGVIDGKLSPNYDQWRGVAESRFNVPSSLDIELSAQYNAGSREVTIHTGLKAQRNISKAKLLLWIIENNVIDRQLVNDAVVEKYEHHHIFRAAVNTTWGEEITLQADVEKTFEHRFTLDEKWNTGNISIVGFVYDAGSDEVFDVNEIHLIKQ